jgi:DegV family protein with EDD domain
MRKIAIITEDVCSLPQRLIREFEIKIVKTRLYFPELEKFPHKNIYQLIQETKSVPKTSAPPPGDYLRVYKEVLKDFEKALVITISSKLSACFNSAFEAKELFEKPERIFLFDSKQAVAGQGLLILKAANLIREGKEIKEILEVLKKIRPKIKLFGFLKTTFWAERSGRINSKLALAFKIFKSLGIYPYFGIKKDGNVGFSGFNFWTEDEFEAIFNQLKHQAKKGKIEVGINYTDNVSLALKLKEKVEKELKVKISFLSLVPPIVGVTTGPGTLIAACYHV